MMQNDGVIMPIARSCVENDTVMSNRELISNVTFCSTTEGSGSTNVNPGLWVPHSTHADQLTVVLQRSSFMSISWAFPVILLHLMLQTGASIL